MQFLENNKKNMIKLILDKNFITEVEKVDKEYIKKSVLYHGRDLDWQEIELYNMEDWKVAPIIRFLVEGKKKTSWLLIILAWVLLLVFFGIMVFILMPKDKEIVKTTPLEQNTVIKTDDKKEIIKEIIPVEKTENKENFELFNEVSMMSDLKNKAEVETLKYKYELDRLKLELQEKNKTIEKLNNVNNNLNNDIKLLNTRKTQNATDDFIYYLWDNIYKKCEISIDEKIIDNCKNLYFNYLDYAKNR